MNKSIIVFALVALVLVQVDANIFSNKITINARLDRERSKFGYLSDEYNAGTVKIKIDPQETTTSLAFAACEKLKGVKPIMANLKREGSDTHFYKQVTVASTGLNDGDLVVVECIFRPYPLVRRH